MAAESLWTGDQPLQQGAGGAANAGPRLRFSHECRRFGCWDRACSQCRNNPLKTCQPGDHFCEVYAQDKPLCAKCGAAVQVVLEGAPPGALPAGAAVLLTVVDGSSGASVALVRAEDGGKVSKRRGGRASRGGDDAGDDDAAAAAVGSGGLSPLLACDRPGAVLPESGALLIPFQDGAAHLPAVRVTRPVSTVTCPRGARLGPLVLIARAVAPAPGGGGRYEEIVGVAPAASGRFVSKSQRAVDDYTKDPFPALASGDLRRVRHVGEVTERRLKANARAADVLGSECPLERVTTVAELRAVVRAARTSPNLHARLVALLNVKGRRSLPLDELSDILEHCTVEEDDAPRLWLPPAAVAPPGAPALGLLFNARRGAAAFERPAALVLRGGGGGAQSPALSLRSGGGGAGVVPPEAVAGLLSAAMDGWWRAGHPGWQRLEGAADLVYVDPATFASAAAASGADAPAPLRALLHGAAAAAAGPAAAAGGSFSAGAPPLPYSLSYGSGGSATSAASTSPFAGVSALNLELSAASLTWGSSFSSAVTGFASHDFSAAGREVSAAGRAAAEALQRLLDAAPPQAAPQAAAAPAAPAAAAGFEPEAAGQEGGGLGSPSASIKRARSKGLCSGGGACGPPQQAPAAVGAAEGADAGTFVEPAMAAPTDSRFWCKTESMERAAPRARFSYDQDDASATAAAAAAPSTAAARPDAAAAADQWPQRPARAACGGIGALLSDMHLAAAAAAGADQSAAAAAEAADADAACAGAGWAAPVLHRVVTTEAPCALQHACSGGAAAAAAAVAAAEQACGCAAVAMPAMVSPFSLLQPPGAAPPAAACALGGKGAAARPRNGAPAARAGSGVWRACSLAGPCRTGDEFDLVGSLLLGAPDLDEMSAALESCSPQTSDAGDFGAGGAFDGAAAAAAVTARGGPYRRTSGASSSSSDDDGCGPAPRGRGGAGAAAGQLSFEEVEAALALGGGGGGGGGWALSRPLAV